MNKNMKLIATAIACLTLTGTCLAAPCGGRHSHHGPAPMHHQPVHRHHQPPPPPPPAHYEVHHHHGGEGLLAIGAAVGGIVGGLIGGIIGR